MIHMICDFCGNACDKEAVMVSLTPIHNFMNDHISVNPEIKKEKTHNFICCQECYEKQIKLPNPYENYSKTCYETDLKVNKTVNNYEDKDFLCD